MVCHRLPAVLIPVTALVALLWLAAPLWAQSVPVTVTFTVDELFDTVCDEDIGEECPNDKYILVNIGSNIPGNDYVRHDFPDNADVRGGPKFSTSRVINLTSGDGNITIDVLVKDRDDLSGDDDVKISPVGGVRIFYDLTTGGAHSNTSAGLGPGDSASITYTVSSEGNDVDGDGIPDNLELFNLVDGAGNVVINFQALGASPQRKDVFVEIDCMEADGNGNGYSPLDPADHSHCLLSAALGDVVQAFANVPVANLDGTQGVQLHIDTGNLYGNGVTTINGINGVVGNFGNFASLGMQGGGGSRIPEAGNTVIDWDGATGSPATNFYTLKAANFNAARAIAFRYAIAGHQTNLRRAANDCTSGWAEGVPGNDFMVTLGGVNAAVPPAAPAPCWGVDANGFSVGTRAEQAGTFMHELGHILGLHHGGDDETNNKPNYLSVMNYSFQGCTVPAVAGLPRRCDYSRFAPNPTGPIDLDERSLDECGGIGAAFGFGRLDWNGDGAFEGVTCLPPDGNTNTPADVNNDGICITFGPNGTQDSAAAAADDNVTCPNLLCPGPGNPGSINDGPNRVCNSVAAPDDVQVTPMNLTPGQPDILKSFDDWAGLVFEFRSLANFANGVSSPVQNEPDPDSIRESRGYLSRLVAPDLGLTISGPATILPAQTVTWTTEARNTGRGPALEVVLNETAPPGGPLPSEDLGTMVVGAAHTKIVQYSVPADTCPVNLVNEAVATYVDLAAEEFTKRAKKVTRVLDIVPPTLTLSLSPRILWPANHKMVTITASITAQDNCDPTPRVRLVSITSNEPDNGLGDGDTPNDIHGAAFGTDDRAFQLRAERSGKGTGRVYTVTYEVEDASGNKTPGAATVTVPHSQP